MTILAIFTVFTCYFLYTYVKLHKEALGKAEKELVLLRSDNEIMKVRISLFERRERIR